MHRLLSFRVDILSIVLSLTVLVPHNNKLLSSNGFDLFPYCTFFVGGFWYVRREKLGCSSFMAASSDQSIVFVSGHGRRDFHDGTCSFVCTLYRKMSD